MSLVSRKKLNSTEEMQSFLLKRNIPSLLEVCISSLTCSLHKLQKKDKETLVKLPAAIRNRILKTLTSCPFLWQGKLDFKEILQLLVNQDTKYLNLCSCYVDKDILKIIKICRNVRKLYICDGDSSYSFKPEDIMDLLNSFKHLRFLIISNCDSVNDDLIDCISQSKNLTSLDIGGCKNVTDRSLYSLAALENVTSLTLSSTQITDDGLNTLIHGPSHNKLKELRLSFCPNITENIIKQISLCCPNLESLIFCNCPQIKDVNFLSYKEGNMKHLKQLYWTIEW